MTLAKRVFLAGEEAAWLADKIVATNEYGNDAARLLRMMSDVQQENAKLKQERDELAAQVEWKDSALRTAVKQNQHDMLMTGEELRKCEEALSITQSDALREQIERHSKLATPAEFTVAENKRLRNLLDAAEAKLKALDEQEPVAYCRIDTLGWNGQKMNMATMFPVPGGLSNPVPLYSAPITPVDVQELRDEIARLHACMDQGLAHHHRIEDLRTTRIAELERKLAEQQVAVCKARDIYEKIPLDTAPSWEHLNDMDTALENCGVEELNTLLTQAREECRNEAVPDGWQVVPKDPTKDMNKAGVDYFRRNWDDLFTTKEHYRLMLAAAPKPEVKP